MGWMPCTRRKLTALLVDQAEFAGSIADYLGLPRVSIALIPPMVPDDRFPPSWFGWPAGQDRLSRFAQPPWHGTVEVDRRSHLQGSEPAAGYMGIEAYPAPRRLASNLVQITQLPEALEFEVGGEKPPGLFYTGPFVHAQQRPPIEFPWESLDGRPLIYASMGTLQNGSEEIFRIIAAACAPLPAQLLISLGGGIDPARLGKLEGEPIVVRYAPQLEILKRAALVITHAGLNTVLESLSEGLPMVAVPLGNDQPGVAARVKARGACVVVSRRKLTPARLRQAVALVLQNPKYRHAARSLQSAIQQVDGPGRAADLVVQALNIGSAQAIAEPQAP